MADVKTVPTSVNAASFVAAIEDQQKRTDSEVLLQLLADITSEPAVMWGPSIVGFGRTHYRYESGREGDTFIVGFSPRKQNLTMYIGALAQNQALLGQLGTQSVGKGCFVYQAAERCGSRRSQTAARGRHQPAPPQARSAAD